MGVSIEDVYCAYRVLLGREASSEEAALWLGVPSLVELRNIFVSSSEFEAAMGHEASRWRQPPHTSHSILRTSAPLPIELDADLETETQLLDYVQKTWTRLGVEEPYWSVLSSDQFKTAQIEKHRDEFFDSGAAEAEWVSATLARCGSPPAGQLRILEFGCGVGRVTPHLAALFRQVIAVDISASHLEMAQKHIRGEGVTNVRCELARSPEFGIYPDNFDVWFSYIVLQHNPPPIIVMILRRMFDCLAPGGLAIFQVPTYAPGYSFKLADYLASPKRETIEVHCLPQEAIFRTAHEARCVPVEIHQDEAMTYPWISYTFVFRKLPATD